MNYKLQNISPINVFRYFEELSAIPRESGNEAAVVEYIEKIAVKFCLEYYKDEFNNIFVIKSASNGKENMEPVLLQGHTDMVCQKNSNVKHDFKKDGVELIVKDDGCLWANGTTLGGDDGIACAYMLALLTDTELTMPRIECLFTSNEEVGMTGAKNFDYSKITARKMINLDSEDEGVCVAGCAGGVRCELNFNSDFIEEKNKLTRIDVLGLCGGHSGSDINSGRQNALCLLGKLLDVMYNFEPFNLVSLNGGNKDNAIPREAYAVFSSVNPDIYNDIILNFYNKNINNLANEDSGLKIRTSKNRHEGSMFTFADTSRIISALTLIPNGVIEMSNNIKGLVETSANIGIVSAEKGSFSLTSLIRSNSEFGIDSTLRLYNRIAKLLSLEVNCYDRYPGWEFKKNSALRNKYIECYKKLYSKEPNISAIHAGLECGLISSVIPEIDIISIGPDIIDIHSPAEHMDIESVQRTWTLLCDILTNNI